MRLTLRTLLAYLDDVLDPADKEELSQKIESSEFAEDLVHRTRDTMRRLRLSAPQVIGTGVALDPNTVSEYLDNVLPPEQVGDFERICLESDVHLAEAAACHHVLTMVLGEPADIDPRLRQRMYGIPAEARERKRLRVESAHGTAAGAKPQAVAAVAKPHAGAAPVEIPEYLRTGSWWRSRGVFAALAVVLLLGTTLYLASGMMGWFGGPAETGTLVVEKSEEPSAARDATTQPVESSPQAVVPAPSTPLGPPPQPVAPGIAAEGTAQRPKPPDVADETADRYGIETSGAEGEAVDTADIGVTVEPPAEEPDRYGIESGEPSAAIARSAEDAPVVAALPTEPEPPAQDAPVAASEPVAPAPASLAPNAVPDAAPMEDEALTGPRELGTYLGGKTVLLRYDAESGAWFRVEPRDAVAAGQRLVALPEFRPKVTFASGVHMDIAGGTQVVIGAGNETPAPSLPAVGPEVPAVEVVYGRLILLNTSMAESTVRLKLGPTVGDARLARNATLAVEVDRQYVPGSDPREAPSPVAVRLFAPEGGVRWQDAGGEKTADASSRWTIEGGAMSEMAADASPPEWIDHEPGGTTSEQRFGAPVVETTLVSNRPVDIQLLELFQASPARREVKSLVTRASIHVGLFEPFVEALRDSEQRANWTSHIEALRAAMALSPESAENVQRALVAQRGERAAADLYEMLCGYNAEQIGRTPEQLKTGAIARLIDWLEEDSLDYRVLAVHNLAEITGKRLMSNPAAATAERAQNVRTWRLRLQKGDLQPLVE